MLKILMMVITRELKRCGEKYNKRVFFVAIISNHVLLPFRYLMTDIYIMECLCIIDFKLHDKNPSPHIITSHLIAHNINFYFRSRFNIFKHRIVYSIDVHDWNVWNIAYKIKSTYSILQLIRWSSFAFMEQCLLSSLLYFISIKDSSAYSIKRSTQLRLQFA